MNLNHTELLVIYKSLTGVELTKEEQHIKSHLVIKLDIEGKVNS